MPSPLKFFYSLIPATCDYVTLPGKRDFIDLIKLRVLRRGEISPDYQDGLTVVIRVLVKRKQVRKQ